MKTFCVKLENDTGLLRSVPPFGAELRTPLPGLSRVSPSRFQKRSALILAILANATLRWRVADNPRRLLHPNDDSIVGSTHAYPSPALLKRIPGRIPSDSHLTSLWGSMVSRYPRGYAVSPTPGRRELHSHRDEVIKDRMIFAPYPPYPPHSSETVVSGKRIAPATDVRRGFKVAMLLRSLSNAALSMLRRLPIRTGH